MVHKTQNTATLGNLIKSKSGMLSLAAVSTLVSHKAFAAGGLVNIVDWYEEITHAFHLSVFGKDASPIIASVAVVLLIIVLGLISGFHKLQPEKMSDEELLPPKKFSMKAFFELCWAVVSSTLENVIGEHHWKGYAGLLGSTFFFILISNLTGLIPGFHPATSQMNMSLAMAIVMFFGFIYVGLKEAGSDFVKHLAGPVLLLAPLMFPIELLSLIARPISLSLRLFGNISGDHTVFQVFLTLVNNAHVPFIPVPAALLAFGTLVSCLQAFIFMTLSAVYIRLSLDTAAHH